MLFTAIQFAAAAVYMRGIGGLMREEDGAVGVSLVDVKMGDVNGKK